MEKDGRDKLFIGLGAGGGGWTEFIDDAAEQYEILDNVRFLTEECEQM